ncbi:Uncharacterised protein [Actinobacillus ureae]|uniref:Uncharacterized protein n=1 Tax=Actinobacillus ureae ATCC 25976 TaxID=887324 RepID=E8KJR0_9PAST|nr:hypothetical protein [Actinobacillus ureae]EFX90916.1 hypothetical protein HMPREF0027_2077 [Actinobacillus ureae ATCC 25976]SUT87250.1 Uncharacterised protein [Actinobacillus ureae]SUU48282.1 Uncharacterised protein [Actinobacillus ureae]
MRVKEHYFYSDYIFEIVKNDEEQLKTPSLFDLIEWDLEKEFISLSEIFDELIFKCGEMFPVKFFKQRLCYFRKVLHNDITLYDVSDYEPFDFTDPPVLPLTVLGKALKEIEKGSDVEDYKNLGFNYFELKAMFEAIREDIEQRKNIKSTQQPKTQNDQLLLIEEQNEAASKHKDLKDRINLLNITPKEKKELTSSINGLARTDKKKTDFIFSLIAVYGSEDMAKNPRQYFIEKKGDIQTGYKKAEKNAILNTFERKGLTFPVFGRTLEKWLNS